MMMRILLLFACLLVTAGASAAEPRVQVGVTRSGEAFIVDATVDAPVLIATAWRTLTDFERMPAILTNLKSSRVTSRDENMLLVKQEGVARYGLFSFGFQSEREVRLVPMERIVSRNLSGTLKRMSSESVLTQTDGGQSVQIRYHAEIVADSAMARMFGASFVRHETTEQFRSMVAEMTRRQAGGGARAEAPAAAAD